MLMQRPGELSRSIGLGFATSALAHCGTRDRAGPSAPGRREQHSPLPCDRIPCGAAMTSVRSGDEVGARCRRDRGSRQSGRRRSPTVRRRVSPPGLKLRAACRHVGNAEGDAGLIGDERTTLPLGFPTGQREVGRLELASVVSLSGSSRTSRYHATAAATSRVGMETKSTCSIWTRVATLYRRSPERMVTAARRERTRTALASRHARHRWR